jgi:NAD+ kinase
MLIKKVGIIANIAKEKSPEYTAALREWMIGRGLEVYLEERIAAKIGGLAGVERRTLWSLVDLIVVFGGDGTILRTVRLVRDRDVPIVGINLGVFGYLTEVNLDEMYSSMWMWKSAGRGKPFARAVSSTTSSSTGATSPASWSSRRPWTAAT